MTWPFENNTNGIVKNLAKRNLKSEKRRNIMVIISVVLAAFLISLSGLVGVSLMQTEKKKVIDTYEATYVQVDEAHIEELKQVPEFACVGEYYMYGEEVSTQGFVVVAGKELAKMNDEQLTIFRRRNIGFIFQNYNLVPILNVYENIVLPVELDGDTVDQKFMDEVVTMLGLEDKLKSMPNNLSGGQQQRVAIARALVAKPAIVLADEPTGNLDSKTSADLLGLLQRTSREFDQTLVMITHNNAIAQLADRIVRIEDGKIVG